MIHKIVTSNKIGTTFLFPLVLLIIFIPFFIINVVSSNNLSVFQSFFINGESNYPILMKILLLVVIMISAFILQKSILGLELQRDRGNHSLYWYGFFNCLFLTSELDLSIPISNLLLIAALLRVFSVYRNQNANKEAFDSGLLLGMASLFNPFYSILILFILIALTTLKTLNFREITLSFVGLFTPIFFTYFSAYFFDLDIQAYYTQLSWNPKDMLSLINNKVDKATSLEIFGSIMTLLVIVYGVFKLIQIANSENTRRSKIFQLLFILTLFMVTIQLLSRLNGMNSASIIILSVPISAMMIHFFSGNRLKWIPLSLFYLWFVTALINISILAF